MKRLLALVGLVALFGVLTAAPLGAITFGQPDGNRHPNVGALLADWDDESPGLDIFCSGTLIDDRVFLTASHCTAGLEQAGITDVFVTFAPEWDEHSTSTRGTFSGTMFTHPDFGSGGANDTFDIAVVVLDRAPGLTPAQLPSAGLLDQMQASSEFGGQDFTAVGYGTVRDTKTKGPQAFFFDGIRRFALQTFMSLQSAWLNLSMQPSTGDGGTCFGDSGGPHFLGDETSNLIVSITITGDAMCRATDKTYRLDSSSSREFLDDFVDLP